MMGLPRIHAALLTLGLFLSFSPTPRATRDEATLTRLFTKGSCSVGCATTSEDITMADNAATPDVPIESQPGEHSQQTVVMEEASQDNSQESQEKMQQSHEGASSQESPAASGKTSPEAGDRELSPDKGGEVEKEEEEEEEEEEEWPPKFPTTLEGFGYAFNKDGQLRNIETGEPFLFEVKKGKKAYNQAHYEALGEVLTEVVYGLLETEGKLQRVFVPYDFKPKEPLSFIFMSHDALTNPNKLMILIHGSGVVRAGQWARRLIINDCLDSGTQLPFIKRAMSEGYGVLVLNTNRNDEEVNGENIPIRGSSTPQEHAVYVWKHYVKKQAKAKRIDIVAHSFGGVVTVDLVMKYFSYFQKRVHKIAFTDSVHSLDAQQVSPEIRRWLTEHAVNWISSPDPLDIEQPSVRGEVKRRSAGTRKHEETSWSSFDSIFTYFASKPRK